MRKIWVFIGFFGLLMFPTALLVLPLTKPETTHIQIQTPWYASCPGGVDCPDQATYVPEPSPTCLPTPTAICTVLPTLTPYPAQPTFGPATSTPLPTSTVRPEATATLRPAETVTQTTTPTLTTMPTRTATATSEYSPISPLATPPP
jgi:hypothetical protein